MGRTYSIKDPLGEYESEVPSHPVDISPFRMGPTPVTVGMWLDIMRPDGKSGYAAWASQVAGVKLILPSEAQWECVAKGGKDAKYPWGNEYDDSKVWCSVKKLRSGTVAVDRLNNVFVNKFGVSDLCSNVLEWCLDGHQPYVKSFDRLGYVSVLRDPVEAGDVMCCRGGSWADDFPVNIRCAERRRIRPHTWHDSVGFRLAAGPK